jgi:hypothetical protein
MYDEHHHVHKLVVGRGNNSENQSQSLKYGIERYLENNYAYKWYDELYHDGKLHKLGDFLIILFIP